MSTVRSSKLNDAGDTECSDADDNTETILLEDSHVPVSFDKQGLASSLDSMSHFPETNAQSGRRRQMSADAVARPFAQASRRKDAWMTTTDVATIRNKDKVTTGSRKRHDAEFVGSNATATSDMSCGTNTQESHSHARHFASNDESDNNSEDSNSDTEDANDLSGYKYIHTESKLQQRSRHIKRNQETTENRTEKSLTTSQNDDANGSTKSVSLLWSPQISERLSANTSFSRSPTPTRAQLHQQKLMRDPSASVDNVNELYVFFCFVFTIFTKSHIPTSI